MNPSERNKLCNFIRKEVLTMVYSAKEGYIGSSFSCVEAIVTLYFDIMNIEPGYR
jgi:transketolase